MKIVYLLEERPFKFRDAFPFYPKGHHFEVLEEKTLPNIGLCYKVRCLEYNLIMEGWNNAKDFATVIELEEDA